MAIAKKDANSVPTITAALNTNWATIVQIVADPSTHVLATNDNTTGSDNGPANALHDQNHLPILMAFSNADGTTPVALYADSSGNLLIDSV